VEETAVQVMIEGPGKYRFQRIRENMDKEVAAAASKQLSTRWGPLVTDIASRLRSHTKRDRTRPQIGGLGRDSDAMLRTPPKETTRSSK